MPVMLFSVLVAVAGAAVLTLLASALIYRSSHRSAVSNMAFGVLLAFAAIGILVIIAAILSWLSARAVFRPQ